jgi:hypothetical protein
MKKLILAPNGGFICCVTHFIGQRCPDCQEFFANPQEALGTSAVAEERTAEPNAQEEVNPPEAPAETAVAEEAPAPKPAKQPRQPKQ